MKGINYFNSTKKQREGFITAATEHDIPVNMYRTRNMLIHLKNNQPVKFINKGEQIQLEDHVNYFQMLGREKHIPSLITLYCDFYDLPFNDPINTNNTLHSQKISQMLKLHLNNLPIPGSIITSGFSYEINRDYILENMQFPVVLKFHGDAGEQVWKIDTPEELDKRLLLSEKQKEVAIENSDIPTALIQEYIPNTHDFRITMYNGETLGVIRRMSKDGFYNNYSRGADYAVDTVTEEETELCRRAAEVCGVDVAGVDMVRTEQGPLFFEVNKAPDINAKYPAVIVKKLAEKYFK